MVKRNKRDELAHRRPLRETDALKQLTRLCNLGTQACNEAISQTLTYAEARQLCHLAGIRQIKGNCRKVLARRINRLRTVDRTGRIYNILRGTTNGTES